MERNSSAMDVSETDDNDNLDGYDTDATASTIDAENYDSDGERRLDEYYARAPRTPPPTNRNTNSPTNFTPPTRLLTNTQIPEQVYKRVIEQDGTIRIVPFTSADYRSGEQPFDIIGRAINRNELPRIQPRRLFGEEKEGGSSKSKRRRRRTKKSLRKRRSSRKRKTNKRRKTRSRK
jgi:hypothetical protein